MYVVPTNGFVLDELGRKIPKEGKEIPKSVHIVRLINDGSLVEKKVKVSK